MPTDRSSEPDTDVVWWRVAQYVVDSLIVLAGVSVGFFLLLAVPADADGDMRTDTPVLWIVFAAMVVWWVFWVTYVWVLRPHRRDGQTFGMQAAGIRIISADGGDASIGQLVGRMLLLVLDGLVGGLVGLLAMLASDRHQRIGDLAARTLVCRVDPGRSGA
jgi:uncharacterized RDD family membrane protein YckC